MVTKNDCMSPEEVENVENVWHLKLNDRWRLYRYWFQQHRNNVCRLSGDYRTQFRILHDEYMDLCASQSEKIFKRAKIVALTTTGAARCVESLRKVAPRIVIVEEAAQVPEQHVLACLTQNCEHLILIGDHKQLKPAYNDYHLTRLHKSDTSLLERMIFTGIEYRQLQLQHRMRPEISSFLRPSIYKILDDDISVKNYRAVNGVKSNVFFISHTQLEDTDPNRKVTAMSTRRRSLHNFIDTSDNKVIQQVLLQYFPNIEIK